MSAAATAANPMGESRQGEFVVRTYGHLLAAIFAFILFEAALFRSGLAEPIARVLLSVNWLFVLGGYMLVAWCFSRLAYRLESPIAQYLGLLGYVLAEGVIFVPLLFVAERFAPGVIETAALVTLLGFLALSWVVFKTRHDFSFLLPFLQWVSLMAFVLIICACLFGLKLGLWFSIAMVLLGGACVLYDTSNVIHHFGHDQHVAAALELFASVALMFWYLIDIVRSWGHFDWWDDD